MLSCFSHVRFFATLWTVAHQAPLSMGFSRQEYRSGLPCPLPGGLPNPGTEPTSLMSPALAVGFFTTRATWEAPYRRLLLLLSRFNCVQLFATLWTVAHQAPLSMGFSQQEYWSGLPFPSTKDLPDPGIKPVISCVFCTGRWVLHC